MAAPALPTFTGDPDIDRNIASGIQSFLQQNAAAAAAQPKDGQPPAQPQAQPWKVNVQGREYTFNSPEELNNALNATFTQFQNTIQSLQAPPADPAPQPAAADAPPKFDMERYLETIKTDPIGAQEYLDSHRYFGGRVEKPSEVIKSQLAEADKNARLLAVYQFKEAHPEYQGNPQAAQVINQLRSELNLPFDFNGLEAAYALARQRGLIQAPQQPQGYPQQPGYGQQPQQPQPQNPFQYQPPVPPGQPPVQIPQAPSPYGPPSPYGADPRAFNGGMGFGGSPNNPFLAPPPALPGRNGYEAPQPFGGDVDNLTPEQIQQIFQMVGNRGPQRPY